MFTNSDLRRLIIPLMLEQMLAVTIGMVNTIMVASVGEAAVSAISSVDTINILLINIFAALATGGAVICAQYLGRQDNKNACIAAKQLLYSTTAISLFIMVIGLIANNIILQLVFGNIPADVMSNAKIYFYFSVVSYPFLAIYNAGAATYRVMGNSKVSLNTALLMNLLNICGNALLIHVFHLGVAGSAISTLVSRCAGAVVMVVLLTNQHNVIHIKSIFVPEYKSSMVKNILMIGIPNGLENGMFQFGKILVQRLVVSFGITAIAANALANSVAGLQSIPGSAISLSLITVVGRCIGAGDYDSAKRYTFRLMMFTYISMGLLGIIIIFFTPYIIQYYNMSQETSQLANWLLNFYGVTCMFIWPSAFVLPNALRASNNAKFTMTWSILSMFLCRVGASFLLGNTFGLGLKGVWIAMVLDWVVRSVAFITHFVNGKWKQKQLI